MEKEKNIMVSEKELIELLEKIDGGTIVNVTIEERKAEEDEG